MAGSGERFTGERLHQGDPLFAVDLARHEAAYRFALADGLRGRVVEFGSGSGYGAALLAEAGLDVLALDRVAPDPVPRRSPARFVRADLRFAPLRDACADAVLSFQVIEHLEDPTAYLFEMVRVLRPAGVAVVTTPNRATSDGENPFHVREYLAQELEALLRSHFGDVVVRGVAGRGAVAAYYQARLDRIRRITRLDPLGIRRRLPRGLVEWAFARLARVVRAGIRRGPGIPDASWRDFPVTHEVADCLDLLAVCREPIRRTDA